ncbi:uncharacterized protein LOC124451852 [Xenia sp. Carnegie-2017]|uniref:uncharacterized protein LOC124451852 n=1 Tax=Xenia sp. Carnegie-2017 TaxID=2897299 RepID=UPI001F04E47E|nr:uncharacterized protein LOC124451852 [Xenia sp. Carnegie-2017]
MADCKNLKSVVVMDEILSSKRNILCEQMGLRTMVSVTITFQMVFMYYTGKQVSLKNFVKVMALLSVLNRIFECSFITVSTKDIQVNWNLVELFSLPHYQADVLSKSHIYKGDTVSFYILENKRNGQCCAVELLLREALPPVYVQRLSARSRNLLVSSTELTK